jgi:CheY-like chemotaxis protein
MSNKLLVVEDNDNVRDNLAELLTLSGYEVVTAVNGKDGIAKIQSFKPDLILCDVMMPELDGFGLLKIISSIPNLATIPFIFLTAKTEKTDFRRGMSLGASDYITKPYDDMDLLQSIETRLKNKQLEKDMINHLQNVWNISANYFNDKMVDVAAISEKRTFKKKDVIFEEGTNIKNIYFLNKGQVRTFRINEFGKELTTRLVKPGEMFGFMDATNNKPYSKSAQCLEQCEVSVIPMTTYLNMLIEDHQFALSLLKHMTIYANILENSLTHQAYSSVRKKAANALIQCYENSGGNPVINLHRDELASLAGTAKETLIRTLSDFKQEGIIDIDNEIILKNINALVYMQQ